MGESSEKRKICSWAERVQRATISYLGVCSRQSRQTILIDLLKVYLSLEIACDAVNDTTNEKPSTTHFHETRIYCSSNLIWFEIRDKKIIIIRERQSGRDFMEAFRRHKTV